MGKSKAKVPLTASKKSSKIPESAELQDQVNVLIPRDLTPQQLMEKGKQFEDEFEPEQALQCYERVMKETKPANKPTEEDVHLQALEASAYILMELQKDREAKNRLMRVSRLNPNQSHQMYMFLAQMSEGREAVNMYKAGVNLLKRKQPEDAPRQESIAYCAIADLYMTDLCDEPEAEQECVRYVGLACDSDSSNAQAWFTKASFHLVKAQMDEAKTSIEKCLELWWPKVQAYLDDHNQKVETEQEEKMDTADEEEDEEAENKIDLEELTGIPFASHITMIRMLLELEMYQKAADMLEVMLEEDDENAEIYYLLVEVGKQLDWKDKEPEDLRFYAKSCKIMSAKLGDVELADEMTELLKGLPESDDEEGEELVIESTDDEDDEAGKEMD